MSFSTLSRPRIAGSVVCVFILILSGCASVPEKDPSIQPLQYPVILVHGMAFRDGKYVGSWGRIPQVLRDYGVDLYFGGTDAWGICETNAELLKEQVETVLRETGKERVNIIGYSTGGIDARYMIWKYDLGGQVASLVTISTPHQGSELADLVFQQKITYTRFGKALIRGLGKHSGDREPAPYELGFRYTRKEMEKFNAMVLPDPRVYYLSVYSVIKSGWDDPLFGWTRWYINRKAGMNDGVVSEKSVLWHGEIMGAGDRISHLEIVDYRKNNTYGADVLKIYQDILERLGNHGF
jgi:triacylglycerol lipase